MSAPVSLPSSFETTHQNPRVDYTLRVIKKHLRDVHLNVNTLAAAVHLSPSHLRRLLVISTGLTPCQLIKHYRLERSKQFLEQTFLSVKEISFEIGLNDVSHFVRDFKRKYGMTPSEYRNYKMAHMAHSLPGTLPSLHLLASTARTI